MIKKNPTIKIHVVGEGKNSLTAFSDNLVCCSLKLHKTLTSVMDM